LEKEIRERIARDEAEQERKWVRMEALEQATTIMMHDSALLGTNYSKYLGKLPLLEISQPRGSRAVLRAIPPSLTRWLALIACLVTLALPNHVALGQEGVLKSLKGFEKLANQITANIDPDAPLRQPKLMGVNAETARPRYIQTLRKEFVKAVGPTDKILAQTAADISSELIKGKGSRPPFPLPDEQRCEFVAGRVRWHHGCYRNAMSSANPPTVQHTTLGPLKRSRALPPPLLLGPCKEAERVFEKAKLCYKMDVRRVSDYERRYHVPCTARFLSQPHPRHRSKIEAGTPFPPLAVGSG